MAKDPAFLFYSSDFLTGVMLMDMEQRGMYITLLCMQHQFGRLSEKHMLSVCGGCEDVLSKFSIDENGLYYNKRLEHEANKRAKYTESRRKNASKPKNTCKAHEKHMLEHMENENRDRDKDINKEIGVKGKEKKSNNKLPPIPFDEIIDYLNQKAGKSFRCTDGSKKLIGGRWNDGYKFDDFKLVIDTKCAEWKGTTWEKYLRPTTLFLPDNFQNYLNQGAKNGKPNAGQDPRWGESI